MMISRIINYLKSSFSFQTNILLQLFIVFGLAILLYSNTLDHGIAQDDTVLIQKNRFVKRGFAGIKDILTTDSFAGFYQKGEIQLSGGRYRPLTIVMFAIETELWGEPELDAEGKQMLDSEGFSIKKYNTKIGHGINIFLYGLLVVMLYIWLLELYNPSRNTEKPVFYLLAFCATLLFTAHPLHTEVVANLKGRDEIMALLCAITTAYFVLRAYHNERRRVIHIVASCLVFGIGLFAKENIITFLAIIPLTFYYFVRTEGDPKDIIKTAKDIITESGIYISPLIMLTVIYWFGVRGFILDNVLMSETMDYELMNNPFLKYVNGELVPFNLTEKICAIAYSGWKYLQLLVCPHPLTSDYYPMEIPNVGLTHPIIILSLLTHLLLLGYAFYKMPSRRSVSFGILYYFITLSVVSNVFILIGVNMAERFVFMPSLGFTLILTYYICKYLGEKKPQFVLALVCIICFFYGLKTISRNTAWKNDLTLYAADVKTSPNSAHAHAAYSSILVDVLLLSPPNSKFDTIPPYLSKTQLMDSALFHAEKCIEIHPAYPNPWMFKGVIAYLKKDYPHAIEAMEECDKLRPGQVDVKTNLGVFYRDWATELVQNQDYVQAIELYGEAISYLPEDYDIVFSLANAYLLAKKWELAKENLEKYLKHYPNDAEAYQKMAEVYQNLGQKANASEMIKMFQKLQKEQNIP
ncbi:MAG: tetratricopeptide repeat protein [Bacteroidia bacterium]